MEHSFNSKEALREEALSLLITTEILLFSIRTASEKPGGKLEDRAERILGILRKLLNVLTWDGSNFGAASQQLRFVKVHTSNIASEYEDVLKGMPVVVPPDRGTDVFFKHGDISQYESALSLFRFIRDRTETLSERVGEALSNALSPEQPLGSQVSANDPNNEFLIKSALDISQHKPRQSIGPLIFSVVNDHLIVLSQPAVPLAKDQQNADTARCFLLDEGADLIFDLGNSNCDPKFKREVSKLHAIIGESVDIVQVALRCQACQIKARMYGGEFSPHILGSLIAYFKAVADYAWQFPEWRSYVENARGASVVTEASLLALKSLMQDMSAAIATTGLADPDVSLGLQWLSDSIPDNGVVMKEQSVAVETTLANLVAAIGSWTVGIFVEAAKTGQVVIGAGIALGVVVGGMYAAWTTPAVQVVFSHLPWFEDFIQFAKRVADLFG